MMSIYASPEDVCPYVAFISDSPSIDLIRGTLGNADSWVNARLLSNSLSIWNEPSKDIPDLLKTAAVYYAASDIILALYNGEEMPTQYDTYFNKAEAMLEAYITQMKRELAESDLKKFNPVKHSKSQSYYQRKHRRPRA